MGDWPERADMQAKAVTAFLVFLFSTPISEAAPVLVLGAGMSSCATWVSTNETNYRLGEVWIMGFWSGRNAGTDGSVGGSSDPDGIIGEVKLYCTSNPSTRLFTAANDVYARMRSQGR